MQKVTFRRVMAYAIDMLIVLIISTAISNIKYLNPEMEKYEETYDSYMEYVNNGVNDNNISSLINSNEYKDYTYKINYYGRYSSLITLIVTFLYFVVFQYNTKGYTGGKRMLNIKVEAIDGKLKIKHFLLRSLIINELFTTSLTILALFLLKKESFSNVQMYIELLNMALLFVTFGMVLYRKDGRGLHDLFAGTKVVKSN